ncbi:MAG TPA: RnfABCDGE type electron transport complex subunit B, partial [Clostridiales bacterium]|nr:RnfABCDGE type electron transport complex subunit B [Clostridiales bacterium]
MNITSILYAVGLLGGIGILAGLVLTFADSKFHVEVDEREARVREAVSGANCGVCGYPGCAAFAAAVVRGEAPVNGCLPGGAKAAEALAEIMGLNAEAQERMV